jgi:two-component system alkaline phosphatase synthesis response regulator PhoP
MAIPSLFILGVREKDAQAAADAARHLGFSVTAAEYKPTTLDAIERSGASVVMADLTALPGGGEVLCRQLTRLPRPVLLLAVVADSTQAASALNAGATVCLTHPLSPSWLAAQLSRLFRLSTTKESAWSADAPMTIRGLRIDPGRCEASTGDCTIPLTPTEFRILACLARSPGIVLSGRDLAEEALDLRLPEQEAMELLKVHVYRLRRKLAHSGIEPRVLRNVRGFGYMLERRAHAMKPARAAVAAVAVPAAQRRSA